MRNKLSSTWGVVPGRQLGEGPASRRFHKRRAGTDAERAVAKALGITLAEARRQLRYAQQYQASRSTDSKDQDWLALAAQRRERLAREAARAETEALAREARVAAHTGKED